MNRMIMAALLFGAMQLPADEKTPALSGRWVMDAEHSSYGRMPLPRSYAEVIYQKDAVITITTTSEDQRGEMKSFLKLTTDDHENVNEINGNEFRSKSHWDGAKLMTTVTGDRGMRMVEVRSVSSDGKTQTVESYMGEARGNPQMKRVMLKSER
jgi:tRNA G10  N-methylase Trm11